MGSQGTGVVSNSWFDIVLFSLLYMFKPSRRPTFKPPSLGPPSLPSKEGAAAAWTAPASRRRPRGLLEARPARSAQSANSVQPVSVLIFSLPKTSRA